MILCERCHTENVDGAQYCDECGASLVRASGRTSGAESVVPSFQSASQPDAHLKAAGPARAPVEGAPESGDGGARADGTSPAHAKVTIDRGHSAGKEFPINDDEAYIGRWDADSGIFPDVDLDVDDPEAKVSRRHARITRRGGQYFIEDLGSTNGTFINRGRRLLPGDRQPLGDGDEIIIGKTFLRFQVVKPEAGSQKPE